MSYIILGISALLLAVSIMLLLVPIAYVNYHTTIVTILIIVFGIYVLASTFTIGDLLGKYEKLTKSLKNKDKENDNIKDKDREE